MTLYFKSRSQFETFASTGSIVKDGVTYTYDPEHDTYDIPVQDYYMHSVKITNGTDILDLIVTTKTYDVYTSVTDIVNDFEANNIVGVHGTLNNQSTDNECVLNFVHPKVSGTSTFGVALIDAQDQAVRCLVLTGTVEDTILE